MAAALAGQTVGTASISGRVYNSITGEALSGVSVKAWSRQAQPPSASSQADGSFRFDGLAAGPYILLADKDGFVSDGRKRGLAVVTLEAGQALTGVQIALLPDGGISGTVTDENGLPVRGREDRGARVYRCAGPFAGDAWTSGHRQDRPVFVTRLAARELLHRRGARQFRRRSRDRMDTKR